MTHIRLFPNGRLLVAVLFASFACFASTPAQAQRSPAYDNDGGDRPRPKPHRGGGGGGGNAGQLILRLAPGIIGGLRDYEEERERPRRRRPREVEDHDEEKPARRKRPRPKVVRETPSAPPPRRVTIIPPIPVEPPNRIPPPPTPSGLPPSPLKRASVLDQRPAFKAGEVVVVVRGAEPDNVAAQLAQNFNLVLLETLNLALLETSRVYRFGIPDDRPVATVAASMANVPGVGFSVPNSYYWLQGEAGAAGFSLQYALPRMRVPDAQEIASGQGMSIAVIDSGVDTTHDALKDANLIVIDTVEGGVNGPDMHGTAITGIIAASGDMTGVAPSAKIIAVRAFASERLGEPPVTTATTLAKSVDQAFASGARIFNMSFAGAREPLLIEMIDAAYAKGSVFVAAAGNEGPDAPPAYPAAHDKVIAITATDEADALFEQANRGGYVFAAAPGVDIFAPVTGQGFDYLSGTSFAAAHVTGVVALLMERNPALSAEAVRAALVGGAQDLGSEGPDSEFGAGLTDAYGTLMTVEKTKQAERKSEVR
ncbi:MAG: S8 family serine peptidase [Rhodomicrobiaceae bacterium]